MQLNYSGSGTIFFKDQEYRCDLYKNTEEGGTMVKISIPKRFAGYLELPLKFDKIAGKLSNGFQFILLKCDRCKMVNLISEERSEYSYTAEYMLNGIGKEYLDVNFSKVSYGITNIIPWGGISEYCITDECKMGYSEEKEIELYKDESMQVKERIESEIMAISKKIRMIWMKLADDEEEIEDMRRKMISDIRKEVLKETEVTLIFAISFEVK